MSNFDQRGQNVQQQVNINVQSNKPTDKELEQKGLQLLDIREYEAASNVFKELVSVNPQNVNIQYYLVLTLLKGQRPRLKPLAVVKEIEKKLQIATSVQPAAAHCLVLWAIVKEDYYVLNGLPDTRPTVAELMKNVGSIEKKYVTEIINHIQAPDNHVWAWLYSLLHSI
jgi:hypothetical protein